MHISSYSPFFTFHTLLWLALCVSLTGLRDAQIAGKTFLVVSVREEISI